MEIETDFLETISVLVWNNISKQELIEMIKDRKDALNEQLTIDVVSKRYQVIDIQLADLESVAIGDTKTNKVLYRKVKDYGYIGDGFRSYNPSRYNVVSKFFSSNAL
jgi:hypothetical protein